jgi:hypothetical protein
MTDYYTKYLKYKNKYLNLKNSNIYTSSRNSDNSEHSNKNKYINLNLFDGLENNFTGGGGDKFYKKPDGDNNTKTVFFTAIIKKDIAKPIEDFIKILIKKDSISKPLHFTILEIHFNSGFFHDGKKQIRDNTIYGKKFDPEPDPTKKATKINNDFTTEINKIFIEKYRQNKLILKARSCNIFGKSPEIDNKYIAIYFDVIDNSISPFRTDIHKLIAQYLNIPSTLPISHYSESHFGKRPQTREELDKDFFRYRNSDNTIDAYATPGYYHGKDYWLPHISLFKIGDLKATNIELYESILGNQDNEVIINDIFKRLFNAHLKRSIEDYHNFEFNTHIENILIS